MKTETIVNALRYVGFEQPQCQQMVDAMEDVAKEAVTPVIAELRQSFADMRIDMHKLFTEMRSDIHRESLAHLRVILGAFIGLFLTTLIGMSGLLLTAYKLFH